MAHLRTAWVSWYWRYCNQNV